ncbi:hypothetical protein TrST_g14047 [Triparma strigata]|uniref:Uncharacterized protein n=1 Tax=Triparma strigata TaxID=1606541 RepID=A0A9W7E982_9STRA|nr:hypothetical protein TrST_g14047 [Triparma strigata]
MADPGRVSWGSNETRNFEKSSHPSSVSGSGVDGGGASGMGGQHPDAPQIANALMGMMGGMGGMGGVGGMAGMGGMPMPMMPMPQMMPGFDPTAQADALSSMDLGEAQKMFLQKAREAKADPTKVQTWGPGGVGGISDQKFLDQNQTERVVLVQNNNTGGRPAHDFYDDYDDDRFGPGYIVGRVGQSGEEGGGSGRDGKFYELMDAAERQAEKMVGENLYGRGLSVEEGRRLESRWNEEDAMAKYIFASQKVAGGYLETARKQKFKRRQRELLRAKEDREDREEREEEEEVGSSPIKLTSEKPKTTVDMFTKSKEGLKKNSEEKSESEEEDEDSSSSEEDRQPAKTAPKNDAKIRAARRARRKENAQLRSHRIMEMDPSALGALRQSIRNQREEDKKKRLDMAKENRDLQNSVIPPPPPSGAAGIDEGMEEEAWGELTEDGPVTVANLMKQHRTVVSSVKQNLETDLTLGRTAATAKEDWVKPPPPPNTYTGTEVGEERDLDTGETVEWRSETRADDLKKAHEGFTKITHAKTLVDVIDTISDLRDDIEKVKKDKRRITNALRKLEKQLKNKAVKGDESGRQGKEIGLVKRKLTKSMEDMDKQQEEMEEMLSELQGSRKRLMEGGGEEGGSEGDGGETTDFGSDSGKEGFGPSDGGLGGLDGLRERRRKRNSSQSSPRAATKAKKSANQRVLSKLTVDSIKAQTAQAGIHKSQLDSLWSTAETSSLASGASASIQTNKDGCPLYYKLLLNIESPINVVSEQRQIYDFLKQSSIPEQVSFLQFALSPENARDLLAPASAFLKVHAHSYKSLNRFKSTPPFTSPHIIQLLTCASESFHVEYLSPVLSLMWLFSRIPSNRGLLIKKGVVGICIKRLKKWTSDKKGVGKKKGKEKEKEVKEQALCALTMLAGVCFE